MLDTKQHFLFDLDPCIRDNDECFTSNSLSAVTDVIPCHLITLNLNSSLSQGLESLSDDQLCPVISVNTTGVRTLGVTRVAWSVQRETPS